MVQQPQYLTPEGLKELQIRLNNLVEVRRPQVAERLQVALEEGGELTENMEYEDAKNEQAFIEAEIARLTYIVNTAKIIEDGAATDAVHIGSRVQILEKGSDEAEVYRLVGAAEANPSQGKISIESPLGKALLGAKVGDTVKIKAPDGDIKFKIQEIS